MVKNTYHKRLLSREEIFCCELRNFFRWLIFSHHHVCAVARQCILKVYYFLQRRYSSPIAFYPDQVKKLYDHGKEHQKRRREQRQNTLADIDDVSASSSRLKLATGFFEYHTSKDWLTNFQDEEQFVSLHRWTWLLHAIIDTPHSASQEWGVTMIRSWLGAMSPLPKGLASEPYTAGERVVNTAFFFSYFYEGALLSNMIPPDIKSALFKMARHVAAHLEYHGPQRTNNHIIQNARALMCAGTALDEPSFSELAWIILEEALPRMITEGGFLREGSSHYHFLFTRWLLEIYFFSRNKKTPPQELLLSSAIKQCLERCWFFLVQDTYTQQWTFPLIGDISPDVPPSWLLSLPWSRQAYTFYKPEQIFSPPAKKGWRDFFEKNMEIFREEKNTAESSSHFFQPFPESGWYRLDLGMATFFWHVEESGEVQYPSHAHTDTGSFVMYWRGIPIFIDPGRPSYTPQDPLSAYSQSSQGHNSLMVDGLSIFADKKDRWLPAAYRKAEVTVDWKWEDSAFIFSIIHTGFRRICGDTITHTRTFFIKEGALRIEDYFAGEHAHTIATHFHFSHLLKVMLENIQDTHVAISHDTTGFQGILSMEATKSGNFDVRYARGDAASRSLGGWEFPSYGEAIPSPTITVEQKCFFPVRTSYLFLWNEHVRNSRDH